MALAANTLTADHPAKLTSLNGVIAQIEALAAKADDDVACQLLTVAAAMRADGLGMGWVHFRVNSSQLQNAIRRRIDPDGKLDLASQAALMKMRELLAGARPLRTNFAALAIENSTAIRLFLTMAQILHHIDADTPIRMLVAECEQPTTVLAALYFAKLFGIEDKVDVSPLFETETALEHGGRDVEGERVRCRVMRLQQGLREPGAAAGVEQAVDGHVGRQSRGKLAADLALDSGGAVVGGGSTLKRLTDACFGRSMH